MDDVRWIVVGLGFLAGLFTGWMIGALVWRNNAKKFSQAEKDIQATVLRGQATAEQKLVQIRNLFKI